MGVVAEERESTQEVLVDLVLSMDLEAAASIDAIRLTVDYQQIVDTVQETTRQNRYRLLESLARQLCLVFGKRPNCCSPAHDTQVPQSPPRESKVRGD